jgi:hypothetical protein
VRVADATVDFAAEPRLAALTSKWG